MSPVYGVRVIRTNIYLGLHRAASRRAVSGLSRRVKTHVRYGLQRTVYRIPLRDPMDIRRRSHVRDNRICVIGYVMSPGMHRIDTITNPGADRRAYSCWKRKNGGNVHS